MRKAIVLVFAVLIVGVAPATAVIGFCAGEACCAPAGDLSLDAESCCGELACDQRGVSAAETTKKQISTPAVVAARGLPFVATTPVPLNVDHELTAVRPLSERLASLSILLI